jgi:retinol dehydrogenase-12
MLSESTASDIKRITGNQKVDYLVADLSSQAEIRRIAEEFPTQWRLLHILVDNAGAMFTQFQESADRIEMTWALNHLGPFLLTGLLLDRMRRVGKRGFSTSAPSRDK